MKRLLLVWPVVLMILAMTACTEGQDMVLVPYPAEVLIGEGYFNAKGAQVTYDASLDEATVNVINAFAQKLSSVSGAESNVTAGQTDEGFIFRYNPELESEAYILDVEPDVVSIEASSLRGFNYAIQTLRQLLPKEILGSESAPRANWTIPVLHINDAPRFAYRGLHFDVSRHFFSVDEVKRYIDIMEFHKLNKLHWHLTDDQGWRIEIKKYPLLTEVGSMRKGTCVRKEWDNLDGIPYGGWYTQDEIREVVAYAASKGIDVIPEIDLPGHMLGALAAYPELGCTGGPYEVWTRWGVSPDVLCAGNENVYEFIEDVLSEVCELFPSEYIHIGGDECPKTAWEKCPECQAKIKALGLTDKDGETAEHYLQSYVITRVEKFLNGRGRKVIGWDEILEGGIAPNATIMSWHGDKPGWKAASMGHDAIMTPNYCMYFDKYQSTDEEKEPFGIGGYLPMKKVYMYEPCHEDMTEEEKAHILGVQANMWTEYIADADHLYYMLLPRLAALSEVQWCREENRDWERFYDVADCVCDRYRTMGYNYAEHILQVMGEIKTDAAEKCAVVTLQSQGDAPIRYTLDGTAPKKTSEHYKTPVVLGESCVFRAASFRKDAGYREFTCRFDAHKALGCNVIFATAAHRRYRAGLPGCLTDGLRGTESFRSESWAGWRGTQVDIVVDMDSEQAVSSVSVGMLRDQMSNIFLPESISVSVSPDGVEYTEVAVQEYDSSEKAPNCLTDLMLTFPESSARYVKIKIVPLPSVPQWRSEDGGATYVFVDEIIVR